VPYIGCSLDRIERRHHVRPQETEQVLSAVSVEQIGAAPGHDAGLRSLSTDNRDHPRDQIQVVGQIDEEDGLVQDLEVPNPIAEVAREHPDVA